MDHWAKGMKILADKTADLHTINPILYEKMDIHMLRKYVNDIFHRYLLVKK